MNINFRAWLYVGLIAVTSAFVSACGPQEPIYKVEHDLVAPVSDSGRLCASQCSLIKSQCLQNVKLTHTITNDRCLENERHAAKKRYRDYVWQRKKKKKPLRASEDSFYFPSNCKASDTAGAASCETSFHQCYSTCGGQVTARSICVANCNVPISVSATGAATSTPAPTLAVATVPAQHASTPLPIAGKWAYSTQACSPSNPASFGVMNLSRSQLRFGLDTCIVDSMSELPGGKYVFKTRCTDGEDTSQQTQNRTFHFLAKGKDGLTWDNKEFNRLETLYRCA